MRRLARLENLIQEADEPLFARSRKRTLQQLSLDVAAARQRSRCSVDQFDAVIGAARDHDAHRHLLDDHPHSSPDGVVVLAVDAVGNVLGEQQQAPCLRDRQDRMPNEEAGDEKLEPGRNAGGSGSVHLLRHRRAGQFREQVEETPADDFAGRPPVQQGGPGIGGGHPQLRVQVHDGIGRVLEDKRVVDHGRFVVSRRIVSATRPERCMAGPEQTGHVAPV